jgi:hypothetical protein
MGKLVGLMLALIVASVAQASNYDAALRLVQDFAAAVQRNPERANEFAADGATIGFGDLAGGRSIARFASETNKCQLRSISQPAVPANWKLDGARYFQILWRCPPPYAPREGQNLTVNLFVKQKIVAGEGHYTD